MKSQIQGGIYRKMVTAISQCVINYWQKQTLICDCMLLTSIRDLYFSSHFNLRGVQVLLFQSKLFLFSFGLYSLSFDWMVLTIRLSAYVYIVPICQYSPREDVCWWNPRHCLGFYLPVARILLASPGEIS